MNLSLGMKCDLSDEQYNDRLKYNPDVIEFFLREDDLVGKGRKRLEHLITKTKDKGIDVYLHHPRDYNGKFNNIFNELNEHEAYYDFSMNVLASIVNKYDIYCVVHAMYRDCFNELGLNGESDERLKDRIAHYQQMSPRFLWENSTQLFTFGENNISFEIIKELDLSLCYDISHSFIAHNGNNDILIDSLSKLHENIKYFHVVDSMGEFHDSLELGKGKIDWKRVKPFINKPYIYEIDLIDQQDAIEQYNSHIYFKNI